MTRRHATTALVPVEPQHRRTWQSLWRRCSCGLPAPCIDRLVPAPPLPFPPRPTGARPRPAAGTVGTRPRAVAPSRAPRRLPQGGRRPRPITTAAVGVPRIRRAAPRFAVPVQEGRETQGKGPPTQRAPAPGELRAKPPGAGDAPVSLSRCPPGGGRAPIRTLLPPGDIGSLIGGPSTAGGGCADGGDRRHDRTGDGRAGRRSRPGAGGSAGGRPAMANHLINVRPW